MNKKPLLWLLITLGISIFLHGLVFLLPDFRSVHGYERPKLHAELRPLPEKMVPVPALSPSADMPEKKEATPAVATARKPPARTKKKPADKPVPDKIAEAALPSIDIADTVVPAIETPAYVQAEGEAGHGMPTEEGDDGVATYAPSADVALRLPNQGSIDYRVDRGDNNFEIGRSSSRWTISGEHYHLFSIAETTGLVWLFRSLSIEMESKGRITAAGLRPETFVIRQKGREIKEWASFDWDAMKVRVGDQPERELVAGTQDLLSFNFQLGFIVQIGMVDKLQVVTGKKYREYGVQVLGKEEIELPVGTLQTIHIRAPGEHMTELWLAYDYLLLPVKIRHVDKQGDVLVQVATRISLGEDTASAGDRDF